MGVCCNESKSLRARSNSSNNLSCNSLQLLRQIIIYLCDFLKALARWDIVCVCAYMNVRVCMCQSSVSTTQKPQCHTHESTQRPARHGQPDTEYPSKQTWGWAMRKWGDVSSYCRINNRSGKWRQAGGLGQDVPVTLEDEKQRQPLLQAGIRGPNLAAVVGIPWVCSRGSLQLPSPKGICCGLWQWPPPHPVTSMGSQLVSWGIPSCWSQQLAQYRHYPFWRLGRKPSLLSIFNTVLEGEAPSVPVGSLSLR